MENDDFRRLGHEASGTTEIEGYQRSYRFTDTSTGTGIQCCIRGLCRGLVAFVWELKWVKICKQLEKFRVSHSSLPNRRQRYFDLACH